MASTPTFELYRLEQDLTREQVIDGLAGIPSRLRDLLAVYASSALARKPPSGDWSPLEVCLHIRDVVQVYGMRFKWMILNDDPFLPNYDEDRWVAESPDGAGDLDAMLAEIAAYRGETVRLLRALSTDAWLRTGRHEVLGSVQLDAYVRHELAHELGHLQQLGDALGAGAAPA